MLLRIGTAKGYFMVTPAALFGTERLFMLFGYSIIGISIFSFFSFQSSMVRSPEDSSEKISSGLNVNVSSALALSGQLNTCLKLFTLPFLRMIASWNSGFYNPQIQISAESGTKRSIFRQKNKTKRSKKRLHTTLIKPEQKVNEDLCSGFIVS